MISRKAVIILSIVVIAITLIPAATPAAGATNAYRVVFQQGIVPVGMPWTLSVSGPVQLQTTATGQNASLFLPAGKYSYNVSAGGVFHGNGTFPLTGSTVVNMNVEQEVNSIVFVSNGPYYISLQSVPSGTVQMYGNASDIILPAGNYSLYVEAFKGYEITGASIAGITYNKSNENFSLPEISTNHAHSYLLYSIDVNGSSYIILLNVTTTPASGTGLTHLECDILYFIHHPTQTISTGFTTIVTYIKNPRSVLEYAENHIAYVVIGILVLIILIRPRKKPKERKAKKTIPSVDDFPLPDKTPGRPRLQPHGKEQLKLDPDLFPNRAPATVNEAEQEQPWTGEDERIHMDTTPDIEEDQDEREETDPYSKAIREKRKQGGEGA